MCPYDREQEPVCVIQVSVMLCVLGMQKGAFKLRFIRTPRNNEMGRLRVRKKRGFYPKPKLKPRWDVHMFGGGDRYEGYAGAPLLLIAGWSGSAA